MELSGWNNMINAESGVTDVRGGYANIYNLTASGGEIVVGDFNAAYGDVLNLSKLVNPLATQLGVSASSLVSAANVGGDMQITIGTGASAFMAADLKGLGGSSLTSLITGHSVVI